MKLVLKIPEPEALVLKTKANIVVEKVVTDVPIYEGEYEVTPTVEGFTVPTEKKYMEKDLKVLEIPFFEVENHAGGNTIYIADEVTTNG